MQGKRRLIGDRAFYAMVLAVAVPIMVQHGITSFVNLLDNVMVGRVGTEEMSGVAIANQLIRAGTPVICMTMIDLLARIRETYDREDATEAQVMRLYADVPLLIIDDLGSEHITDYTRSQLFQILNERSLRKKPFLLSTNHDLQELREEYFDRIFSRLVDNSYICHLTGQDIRLKKKIENDHK